MWGEFVKYTNGLFDFSGRILVKIKLVRLVNLGGFWKSHNSWINAGQLGACNSVETARKCLKHHFK